MVNLCVLCLTITASFGVNVKGLRVIVASFRAFSRGFGSKGLSADTPFTTLNSPWSSKNSRAILPR